MNTSLSPMRATLLRLAPAVLVFVALACTPAAEEGVPQAGPATDDLLALLPSDAFLVGWMDVDALRESSAGSAFLEDESGSDEDYEDLRRFTEATGIEMEDIHQAGFAGFEDVSEDTDAVVVAAARVDYEPARMTELLAERPTLTHGDRTLYELDESMWNDDEVETVAGDRPEPTPDDPATGEEVEAEEEQEPPYLVMLDAGTLLFGNERGVRASLDTIDADAASLRDNAALIEIIESASEGSQAWIVVTRDAWADQMEDVPAEGMPVPRSAIEGIERMTLSLGVQDGFMLRVIGLAGTEEDATLLADAVRGGLSMAKMMIQEQQPEIFSILDQGITVGAEGRELRLQVQLTEPQIEALRQFAEEQMPAEPGSGGS